MEELLLIDKPKGITSMDVIRRLRKELNIRKIGHAGTLDPLATGLMLVGVGQGTKRLTELIKLDKEYIAEVRIGEKRATGDLEGDILETKPVTESLEKLRTDIKAALAEMLGTHVYLVSAYSAIKKDGIPMYKRARAAAQKGELVPEVPVREMTLHNAKLNSLEPSKGFMVATVTFQVGSGTYIRSLGEALGDKLGYPATLQNLRRTMIGEYEIKNARPV